MNASYSNADITVSADNIAGDCAGKKTISLIFIVACHNRRAQTTACLESIEREASRAGVRWRLVAFDDGSSDGTFEALTNFGDSVTVLYGDGSNFWARSMATAERHALRDVSDSPDDVLVWINDDCELLDGCLDQIVTLLRERNDGILVGAMVSSDRRTTSYSGLVSKGLHPLKFALVSPNGNLQEVDTFNGNLVFVHKRTALRLGGIDGGFSHALADFDYGLRAKEHGIPIMLLPQFMGICDRDHIYTSSTDSVWAEWRKHIAVKGGGEPKSLRRALSRHSPGTWILFWVGSYTAWWARAVSRSGRLFAQRAFKFFAVRGKGAIQNRDRNVR
ncbi:glycosyltransferase family 2 protein [Rhodococcus sp. 14-1411-2a]|uniref:glycosyltransferase family 2 protein n=1 Tax=Rhodococcus sp. 14-1411-2a TaxID=2023151 RepID=UPI000B9AA779|nr:glycosyltransferase [Rhodococcus sp. 14-1411-2a]OZF51291.1 hypothetical protein CH291_06920 [Rhodococcus sp. 14-1411-2a]